MLEVIQLVDDKGIYLGRNEEGVNESTQFNEGKLPRRVGSYDVKLLTCLILDTCSCRGFASVMSAAIVKKGGEA